jgi:putative DNA primase/helicase
MSNDLQFSEDALALKFAETFANDVRHCQSTSPYKWFVLGADGAWQADNTNAVLNLVREVCRAAAKECEDPTLARTICSVANITAVERLARTDRRLAAIKAEVGIVPKRRGK